MIIDFHTHIFPDKIAASTIKLLGENCGITAYSDGTLASLVRALDVSSVDIAINLPPLTKPTQFDSVKNFALGINNTKFEKSRIISFAGIHPECSDVDSKLCELKELGFKGIKLHPDYQGTFFDDKKYIEIIKFAKKYGLIVVTHAGLDAAYIGEPIKCTPKRVLRLLDAVGGYSKLVLAHLGGNTLFDEVYELLAGEDVYFDTAYILSQIKPDMFLKILEKHGEDKILFATDSPWQDIKKDVERLRAYNLEKRTEEKIFSKNAISLLKL